jgi:hypothetical protein
MIDSDQLGRINNAKDLSRCVRFLEKP